MGENSKIEWTTHTFNPWIGCTKVSPGCAHCYAEREFDHRHHKAKWGAGQPRVRTSPGTWAQPLKWDRAAAKAGVRARVFCASLADVFDPEVPTEWLADLFVLIEKCRNLDWLLLTKRPERIMLQIHEALAHIEGIGDDWGAKEECETPAGIMLNEWVETPPDHVWLGTTVEDQDRARERISHLINVPARIRFLSCEPLLGPISLRWLHVPDNWRENGRCDHLEIGKAIQWIIVGGESGPEARAMHPSWVRTLRDQAQEVGMSFMFKQWGEWAPCTDEEWHGLGPHGTPRQMAMGPCGGKAGGFLSKGLADQRKAEGWVPMGRIGKVAAGRILDGRTWDEVPAVKA